MFELFLHDNSNLSTKLNIIIQTETKIENLENNFQKRCIFRISVVSAFH